MSDWVVAKNWSSFVALPIVKRTEKRVVAREAGRDRHFSLQEVLAVLPEERAKAMAERLVSSLALARDEQNKASQRHLERVKKIVAEQAK